MNIYEKIIYLLQPNKTVYYDTKKTKEIENPDMECVYRMAQGFKNSTSEKN
jgi:hypothetical protein